MKSVKKIIAALSAATMVSACAGVVASAAEAVNAVNVSYSTVAETFTAADGTVVPAGATAVTLSIENNTGFSASDITLNATADLLAVDGMVAATNGSAYGDAIVSAAQNGSKVVITSASLDDSKADGTLVTFYTTSAAEVTVEDATFKSAKQMEDARTKILNGEAGALPYKRGQESGCDYCPYRHVCGFDVKIPGYEYRDIGTMGKEEAMAAMRIEQRESENDRKGGNQEWV